MSMAPFNTSRNMSLCSLKTWLLNCTKRSVVSESNRQSKQKKAFIELHFSFIVNSSHNYEVTNICNVTTTMNHKFHKKMERTVEAPKSHVNTTANCCGDRDLHLYSSQGHILHIHPSTGHWRSTWGHTQYIMIIVSTLWECKTVIN